jgi:hypothetical protein
MGKREFACSEDGSVLLIRGGLIQAQFNNKNVREGTSWPILVRVPFGTSGSETGTLAMAV